jgi:DNA-binding response OmpR family regulator
MKIALIEDDPTIREMMTTALELANYAVLSWADGPSFVEWVASQEKEVLLSLGLLITDWCLPGGSCGGDVIDSLRQQSQKLVPALIVTGTCGAEMAAIRGRYPEVPIIRKPFHIRDLLRCIQQIVPCL